MEIGIVGLPNVGKSTLFNALTCAGAEASNYPFCTIEPNVGIVAIPDKRLDKLFEMFKPPKKTAAFIKFVDIAGIVKGATWTHSLASGDLSDAGATKSWTSGLLTMSWTHAFTWESSTHYLNWVGGSTNHYQIGASNNRAMTSLSLTSSDYTAGIESVTLTCGKATGSTVTIDVYVGGDKVASNVAVSQTGSSSAQKITFDKLYQGSLRIDFNQSTSSKAFYLKALQIN